MESSGASDFLAGFDALAQAVRRARGANASNGGLTLSQYGLLEVLADQRSARVQELAGHAGITAPTATRILDALERRGIVRRERSEEDRRAVAVSLTPHGRELLQAEQEWLRGRERAFYAALPADEQELAPDLLFRLAALIDQLAAGPEHKVPRSEPSVAGSERSVVGSEPSVAESEPSVADRRESLSGMSKRATFARHRV